MILLKNILYYLMKAFCVDKINRTSHRRNVKIRVVSSESFLTRQVLALFVSSVAAEFSTRIVSFRFVFTLWDGSINVIPICTNR